VAQAVYVLAFGVLSEHPHSDLRLVVEFDALDEVSDQPGLVVAD
jgi:hypothetical protein